MGGFFGLKGVWALGFGVVRRGRKGRGFVRGEWRRRGDEMDGWEEGTVEG